jgi:hypothetical protein
VLLGHVLLLRWLLRCVLLWDLLLWDLLLWDLLLWLGRLLDSLVLDWLLGSVLFRGRCGCRAVLDRWPVSGVLLSRPLVW